MHMKRDRILFWLAALLVFAFFSLATYRVYGRIGAFGCGDECINYTAGHFLLQGKRLYSEIFFNRQPFMAYLSTWVQWIARPSTLYKLVLVHRICIALYSLTMGGLLIWRFRWAGLLFLTLYEGTKFYLYGYQFIAEALVVYP